MKLFKWLFKFSGVDSFFVIAKIVMFGGFIFLCYKGFMFSWLIIARNEPQTKQTLNTLYSDAVLKNDSIQGLKSNVAQLNYELMQCDTNYYNSDQKVISLEYQIVQHQRNNYDLKKQLEIYRRDNKVCYKINIFGKSKEVPCSDINLE